jgi:predicted Fe-Mo cluster-binding NifX family protein
VKIAISTDGAMVSAHFGRCPSFTIVDIDGESVVWRDVAENPGHHPGSIPKFLREMGVEYIIAGGMGRRASDLFDGMGIKAILGVSGSVDDAIAKILDGTLEGGESLCMPGAGKGYGIDKDACDHGEEEE